MELYLRNKKHGRLPRTKKLWFIMEKYGNVPKQLKFLRKIIALELWFTMEKLLLYGKNYGTFEKTKVL